MMMDEMHPILQHWMIKASNGDVVGVRELGTAFADGDYGLEEDQEAAVWWWRFGADKGDAFCQANLGSRLVRGYGVEIDEAEGFHYYMLSAKQGHYTGLYGAAVCYMNGEGVTRDLDEAWLLIQLALKSAKVYAAAGKDGNCPGNYIPDIEGILAKINYMRGGSHAAVIFDSPGGTVVLP